MLCGPYSAGNLHSVSDQMQNLPNYSTTPNKMTSENDLKGLVSSSFVHGRTVLFFRLFTFEGDMEYTGCGNTEHRGLKARVMP